MRFRVCDRMLAALSGLLIILLGVLVALVGTGLLPVMDLSVVYGPFDIWQRVIIIVAGLLLCLLGVHGLWMLFRRRADKGFIVQRTDLGDMNIAMSALTSMVNKCVDQHQEIKVKKIRIHRVRDGVIVDLKILLANGINIPLTVNVLQKQIKQYITSCSGVDVHEVRVQIDTSEMILVDKAEESVAAGQEIVAPVALQDDPVVEAAAESILRHTEEPADYVEAIETVVVQEEPAAELYAPVEAAEAVMEEYTVTAEETVETDAAVEDEVPVAVVEYAAEEADYEEAAEEEPVAESAEIAEGAEAVETAEEVFQQPEETDEEAAAEEIYQPEAATEDAYQPAEEAVVDFVGQGQPVQEEVENAEAEEDYTDFFAQPQENGSGDPSDTAGLWTQIGEAFVRREETPGEEETMNE